MSELQELQTTLEPSETLFVVDSMQGQNALPVAAEFNKSVKLSGVVLTKVDGDSREGNLAVCSVSYRMPSPIRRKLRKT